MPSVSIPGRKKRLTCRQAATYSGEYPRVVIVTANPLRRDMANGIMLSTLFDGWPAEQLAQVYFPSGLTYLPEFDVCREFSMIRTLGRVRRLRLPDAPRRTESTSRTIASGGGAGNRWKRTVLQYVKQQPRLLRCLRVGQEFWYAYSWIGQVLERELCHLRPEIVYADVGNFCLTRIICRACKHLEIPLYLHVGDDYVHALYRGMPLEPKLQALSEHWFREAVELADGLETVSPIAVDEFQRRYGKKWTWFTALADPDCYDATPRAADGTIRLVYTGNLGIDRWRTLRQLGLALKSITDTNHIPTQLDIYSTPEQLQVHRNALDIPGTNLRGWVTRDQLAEVLHNADILVHVEGFDPVHAEYARLSFSTKLSDYMMAGRCILAVGPGHLASARMIQMAQAGIALEAIDPATVTATLLALFRDAARRESLGRAGRTWAMRWFNERPRRESFRQAIVAALDQARSRREPLPRAA